MPTSPVLLIRTVQSWLVSTMHSIWMLKCCDSMQTPTATSSSIALMPCRTSENNGKMPTWMDSVITQQVHSPTIALLLQEFHTSLFKAVMTMSTTALRTTSMRATPTKVVPSLTDSDAQITMRTVGRTTMGNGSTAIDSNRIGSNPKTAMVMV